MIPVDYEDMISIYYLSVNEQAVANVPVRVYSVYFTHLCRLVHLAKEVQAVSQIEFPNIASAISYGMAKEYFIQSCGDIYNKRAVVPPPLLGVSVPPERILTSVLLGGKVGIYIFNQYRAVMDTDTYMRVECDLSSTGSVIL